MLVIYVLLIFYFFNFFTVAPCILCFSCVNKRLYSIKMHGATVKIIEAQQEKFVAPTRTLS